MPRAATALESSPVAAKAKSTPVVVPDSTAAKVTFAPVDEPTLNAIATLAPNLDPTAAREIYATTLRQVLEKLIPDLVAREVARQVEQEIEAIKALAAADK